jgi:antitoxin component of RelBE/YafQ-DinJ toxin-antitoxin module
MDTAMVTARMSRSKKDAGNRILADMGYTASKAINELYDHVLETGSLPFAKARPTTPPDSARLRQALAFVDSIAIIEPSAFDLQDRDELKKAKLIAKGRASEEDFL